ncbi:CDP-alcohol phosphatidyltransferase family protein [Prevotella fusca]
MTKEQQNKESYLHQSEGNPHLTEHSVSPSLGEGEDSGNSFRTLLRASFKSMDTEEWLDVYFTRPIGLAFALLWHRLGVTPNAITILSIFLGVGAGVMFFFTDTLYNVLGIILLMLANFCDSTDGQLARLTKQQSMKGRCLDGFAGDVWFFAIYLAIVFRLWNQSMPGTSEVWGFWGLALVAVAGLLSHSPQSSLSDYYRQIHLYFLKGKEGAELDSYEREHIIAESLKGEKGVFWDRAFHSNYQRYCKSQERRTPMFQKFHAALMEEYGNIDKVSQNIKDRFLSGSRPLMPYTNFLSFNSRAILIYVTCLLNCPWVYLLFEITIYNILYVYMHKRHEDLCRSLTPK